MPKHPKSHKKEKYMKNSELYQPAKPQAFQALLHHLPTLLKTRIKVLLSGKSEVRILRPPQIFKDVMREWRKW